MQQPNNSKNLPRKGQNPKNDFFIESLRGIGNSAVNSTKNDLLKPGVKDIFDSFSPFSFPTNTNQRPSQGENPNLEADFWEKKYRQQAKQNEQLKVVKREETIVFTREQRETQSQVKGLQEEIQKMAQATGELAHEVQVATMQQEVKPGVYQLNFLQRLYLLIKKMRSEIQESSYWLASWNKKTQKKNGYWGKFKKSGSSFSLHHDRAVATQAG